MKPLEADEYLLLKTKFKEQLELIEHKILGRGLMPLVAIYERITETKLNKNCSDCWLDMMTCISIAYKNYNQTETKTKPKRKRNAK